MICHPTGMIEEKYESLDLKNFQIHSLKVRSKSLKGNALKDPVLRRMPLLVPKNGDIKGVVWILSGFSGNSPNYLNPRPFENNFAENLDFWVERKLAPNAIYVFVDAWTSLGGSQFINSSAIGNYEDYIIKDLYPEISKKYPGISHAIMGGSSGGYGALHLSSKYPNLFSYCGAIAPDAFFEALFLPEFYKTANFFINPNNDVKKMLATRELLELGNWHSILNVYAMSACYSPRKKEVEIPFDFELGELKQSTWKKWLAKDPVEFLPKRMSKVKKLKGIFLEVGRKDQFYLYFGSRQIRNILKKNKIPHHYEEFKGGHFDLSSRREAFLTWLSTQWS